MSRRALWEQLWKRFDPDRPPYTQWRAERPHSPAGRILRRLDRRYDTPRILLTGTVGTGKTTELMRVAEEREGPELGWTSAGGSASRGCTRVTVSVHPGRRRHPPPGRGD